VPVTPGLGHGLTTLRRALLWSGAWIEAVRRAAAFREVRCFCLFTGWPRSGHSIVGALLNAHPHAVIAHELDALRQIRRLPRRDHLFAHILLQDRWFGAVGRGSAAYDYNVPGLSQGRWESLQVIGDKNGGITSRMLGAQPELLDLLRSVVAVPIRLIRVVRNPWDNVATIARVHRMSPAEALEYYLGMAHDLLIIERHTSPDERFTIHLQDLVESPAETLGPLFAFLDLSVTPGFLDSCAASLFPAVSRTRQLVDWPPGLIAAVERRTRCFDFLERYHFES